MLFRKAQRNTRQRRVVLEELNKLTSHPTAAELYDLTRARLPKISLGTVYRNLELLADNGIIRKLETVGAEARFDGNPERHYHVRCVRCGRVDDAHGVPANPLKREVKTLAGYQVLGFRLEFVGVCPGCRGQLASGDDGVASEAERWTG